jgi:hypothetical protein
LLRWTAEDLANAAKVGVATIRRMEVLEGVPAGNVKTLVAIQQALEDAGIEFIGSPDDAPGVRLRGKKT